LNLDDPKYQIQMKVLKLDIKKMVTEYELKHINAHLQLIFCEQEAQV